MSFRLDTHQKYLSQAHKSKFIDLLAVTVTGAGGGAVPPGAAYFNANCMLDKVGLDKTIVERGDNRDYGPRIFPYAIRNTNGTVIEAASGCIAGPFPPLAERDAVEVLESVLLNSPDKVKLIVLGPWTNIQKLLKRNPQVVDKIDKVYAMGGSTVGGNICCHALGGTRCSGVRACFHDVFIDMLNGRLSP